MAKIKGLGYTVIFTNEFRRTYDFYSKLGFKTEWSDKKKMAMLRVGKFKLFIHPRKTKKPVSKLNELHMHLLVDDIDALFNQLKNAKLKLPKAPKTTSWGHRSFPRERSQWG